MKKLMLPIVAALTLVAVNTTMQAQTPPTAPVITTVQLPRPIGQSEVDWFADVADSSGFTDWGKRVEAKADSALTKASAPVQQIVRQVPYTGPGAGFLKVVAVAAESFAAQQGLARASRDEKAGKFLTAIMDGARAGNLAASRIDSVLQAVDERMSQNESRVTQTISDSLATIADLRQQVAELKANLATLNTNLTTVANNTAIALGERDPATDKKPSGDEKKTARTWLRAYKGGF